MRTPSSPQRTLFEPSSDDPGDAPEGFELRQAFISQQEEEELSARLSELPFRPFEFRGFLGRRQTVSFGWRYDFSGAALVRAEDFPDWLQPLRGRAAAMAGVSPHDIGHALLNLYAPGAPIGWHRDRAAFDKVVGVSLLSPCRLRFRRRLSKGFERRAVTLAPRSAYLLDGPARWLWEHSIPPAAAPRYSITFRTFSAGGPSTD